MNDYEKRGKNDAPMIRIRRRVPVSTVTLCSSVRLGWSVVSAPKCKHINWKIPRNNPSPHINCLWRHQCGNCITGCFKLSQICSLYIRIPYPPVFPGPSRWVTVPVLSIPGLQCVLDLCPYLDALDWFSKISISIDSLGLASFGLCLLSHSGQDWIRIRMSRGSQRIHETCASREKCRSDLMGFSGQHWEGTRRSGHPMFLHNSFVITP